MKLENTVKASIILSAGIVVASLFIGEAAKDMKICGFKLRGDCPGDLKDLILLIKEKADSDAWK